MEKKNMTVLLLAALAGLSVVSCARDLVSPESTGSASRTIQVSVEAEAAALTDETKTTFDGQKLVWTGNETMDVLVGNTSSTSSSAATSSMLTIDPASCTFSGTVALGDFAETDIRAITVPGGSKGWIRYKNSSLRARVPIPLNQVQEKDGVMNGNNFPLYAPITETILEDCKQADGSYRFRNIQLQWGCAVMRFNVYGTHSAMSADEVLKSINVRMDSFPGNFEARLDNNEIIRNNTASELTVTLTEGAFIAGKTKENGVKVYMAMFPYKNNIREITVTTDKAVYTLKEGTAPLKVISGTDLRGQVFQFGLNLASFTRADSFKTEYYKKEVMKIIKAANLPSMQVMYTKGDDISYSLAVVNEDFYAGLSNDDFQENSPITTNSIYHACSIGKVPMAYVAMKLVEEGKLDIDRTAVSYYPDPTDNEIVDFFKDDGESRENAQEVTVRQLLLHLSGISNNFSWSGDTKDVVYLDTVVEQYRDKSYRYSTNAIHVLDLVLGQIIGAPLQDYENTYIFDKIGMKHSSYLWLDEYATAAVKGQHSATTYYLKNGWTVANAGLTLYTSAEEYTKFLRWILDGADFIGGTESEHYKAMFKKYGVSGLDKEDGSKWQGLIWVCCNQEEFGNIYMHSGSLGGFRGQMLIVPDSDETFICLTNATTNYNYKAPMTRLFLGKDVDALQVDSSHPKKIVVESDTEGDAGKFIIVEE